MWVVVSLDRLVVRGVDNLVVSTWRATDGVCRGLRFRADMHGYGSGGFFDLERFSTRRDPAAAARSASGISWEIVLVYSPLPTPVASVQSNAAFRRYIGGVRGKLSRSRLRYRQTRQTE
jgi:hypothetical protein